MNGKQIPVWILLVCLCVSCAACVWAWLFALHLLIWFTVPPAFFLQALIRRGGKAWKWLLSVHVIIILCAMGVGGLIILLGKNWEPLLGMLLAAAGASALVGCLIEWILYWIMHRKDGKNETKN